MSVYGPALFITRKDGADISAEEQKSLLAKVVEITKALNITGHDSEPADPDHYDYDGYEDKALGILLHSTEIYGFVPEEVYADMEEGDVAEATKVSDALEKDQPETYTFKAYVVES